MHRIGHKAGFPLMAVLCIKNEKILRAAKNARLSYAVAKADILSGI